MGCLLIEPDAGVGRRRSSRPSTARDRGPRLIASATSWRRLRRALRFAAASERVGRARMISG